MNRIKARLSKTSGSWIASIIMVINLVKITGRVCHTLNFAVWTFSASSPVVFDIRHGYGIRKFDPCPLVWENVAA